VNGSFSVSAESPLVCDIWETLLSPASVLPPGKASTLKEPIAAGRVEASHDDKPKINVPALLPTRNSEEAD
jgi:hypothetical protein